MEAIINSPAAHITSLCLAYPLMKSLYYNDYDFTLQTSVWVLLVYVWLIQSLVLFILHDFNVAFVTLLTLSDCDWSFRLEALTAQQRNPGLTEGVGHKVHMALKYR